MASFSLEFPYAYHVLPLHLWRSVVEAGGLVSKDRQPVFRQTTAAVDRRLGFRDVVHLYLASAAERILELPLLRAQLQASSKPPFPHVVLELPTKELLDADCIVCNWNLAVSRPGVPGYCKGGNWTRGTDPEKILSAWEAFRQIRPDSRRARGFFKQGLAVPVLTGGALKRNVKLLGTAPGKMPELIMPRTVAIDRFSRVVAFGRRDSDAVSQLAPPSLQIATAEFPGYREDLIEPETRSRVSAILNGTAGVNDPHLDFDRIRPAAQDQL